MPNELIVKQYKIILDEFDLEMVRQIVEEMNHDLYSLPIEESTIQNILIQIINQSNNDNKQAKNS
jgi:hypothetical protein